MERFKSLLQKLQEVYNGSQQKSAIDIDLMLDYTRVMYADLLEWRKEFTDPLRPSLSSSTPAESAADAPQPAADQAVTAAAEKPALAKEEAPAATVASTDAEATSHQEAPVVENSETAPAESPAPAPAQPEEKVVETPQPAVIYPEKEDIAALSRERIGISYEPPFLQEKPVVLEDVLVEEAPVEPMPVVEDMPAPAPVEIPLPEFKPYEPAKLFDTIVERKDIRTAVGINDKYLFLNELFNNHKSDYEETMDMLNRLGSQEDAQEWVRNKVAGPRKWDREDPTVQSFYALISKHFSAR